MNDTKLKEEKYLGLLTKMEGVLDVLKMIDTQAGQSVTIKRNVLNLIIKDMDQALDELYEYQSIEMRETATGKELVDGLKGLSEVADHLSK